MVVFFVCFGFFLKIILSMFLVGRVLLRKGGVVL